MKCHSDLKQFVDLADDLCIQLIDQQSLLPGEIDTVMDEIKKIRKEYSWLWQ